MITIRLNDRPYKVASCWEEVTVKQYVRIIKEWEPEKDIADRDYFILLGILTGAEFAGMHNSLENQVTLTNILGWVITQPFQFSKELPKALLIGDKTVSIPGDPRELSIGQNIHLRRDYIDKSKLLEENMSIAVAIYVQPEYHKSLFQVEKAVELSKIIDEMPISVIYPIGFFLLNRALRFGQKPEKTWPLLRISPKEMLKSLFRKWRKSTALTGSTISRS